MRFQNKDNISDIVNRHIKCSDNQFVRYPSLLELFRILDELSVAEQTTRYIHIVPFYRSVHPVLWQEEFDIASFYVECRKRVSELEKLGFSKEFDFWSNPESDAPLLRGWITDDDLKRTKFLLNDTDKLGFQDAIKGYKEFLMERGIPQMINWLKEKKLLKDNDLPYGYFCFEVTCE